MDFLKIAYELLERDEELSPFTRRNYFYCIKKLEHFAPQLDTEQINIDFIKAYREHLAAIGNKPATVSKSLSVFRNFWFRLKNEKLVSTTPFDGIRIKRVQGNRQYLDMTDLRRFYTRFLEHEHLLRIPERNAVRAFLFGCFTGLRYQDLKSLTFEEIHDGHIRKKMHKTGDYVYIPIPRQAMLLLPKLQSGPCLKVSENSYFNKFLRSGAQRLGIHQRLHCHLARHTFATTCLSLDIPLAVTSKLLGHRDVSTTLIYAKYVDRILDKEMRKFNKF